MAFLLEGRDKMQKIETEHGVFTENTETGQTAEQVYAEWLENRDKPPQPTQEELLKQELTKTNAMVLELTEIILGGM